jgi:hypothetical protein
MFKSLSTIVWDIVFICYFEFPSCSHGQHLHVIFIVNVLVENRNSIISYQSIAKVVHKIRVTGWFNYTVQCQEMVDSSLVLCDERPLKTIFF